MYQKMVTEHETFNIQEVSKMYLEWYSATISKFGRYALCICSVDIILRSGPAIPSSVQAAFSRVMASSESLHSPGINFVIPLIKVEVKNAENVLKGYKHPMTCRESVLPPTLPASR